MNKNFAIAIDGPSGVGKSTLAKFLAESLSIIYVDTGAMYRAVALYCIKRDVPVADTRLVESILPDLSITIQYIDHAQRILLNGEDVTNELRSAEVTDGSSKVAVIPAVRAKLMRLQQQLAESNSVVMDGRDIGSKVLPNAQLKFFLDADVDARARRRVDELIQGGRQVSFETVRAEVEQRDFRDTHRVSAPLVRVADAIYLDTTNMTLHEVEQRALEIVNERL
jgi:cytidylate kinase